MPYKIIEFSDGYRVMSDKGHYLSNRPLSYENALKQMRAVSINEGIFGSGLYTIHSVVFHKPYNLNNASQEAKNIIKHNDYKMRETKQSYRFSVPKQYFYKDSYRTKKINPNISIIFGELIE